MAAIRYLIQRDGRYAARIVVPPRLRNIVGKRELSASLGADRKEALHRLPGKVAEFLDILAAAEATLTGSPQPVPTAPPPRRLTPKELARLHYSEQVDFDTELRNTDPLYAALGSIDERYVDALRDTIAGRASNQDIIENVGRILHRYRQRGYRVHAPGTPEWRDAARHLARAELEAVRVAAARDDGDVDPPVPSDLAPEPTHPAANHSPDLPPLKVEDVFKGYERELTAAGKGRYAARRWAPVIQSVIEIVGEDARSITKQDAVRWKDALLGRGLAPKTIRDSYLATVRAAFTWAADNERLKSNPFDGVKIRFTRKIVGRERGFTDAEAQVILKAARAYAAPASGKEHPKTTAAKRWTPLLTAHTGARIGEIAQLRQEDVKVQDGITFLRLTPDAGSIKTGQYRDVPLHPQLIELDFPSFVAASRAGPLFYDTTSLRSATKGLPGQVLGDKIAKWVRSLGIRDPNVQPNHGWRHRLKTLGRDVGIDSRVLDAIQGHAAHTAGDSYGDVSLKAKWAAIQRLPRYEI